MFNKDISIYENKRKLMSKRIQYITAYSDELAYQILSFEAKERQY